MLHKSSKFWQEEQDGFRLAFKDLPVVQLVALSPSSIRLVTHASYPPSRGTLLSVDEARHYLFTSGYLPELGTYPGPHIPIPVEMTVHGDSTIGEIREAAYDSISTRHHTSVCESDTASSRMRHLNERCVVFWSSVVTVMDFAC